MGFGILVSVVLFSVALVFYEPSTSKEEAAIEEDSAINEDKTKPEETKEEVTEETVEDSSEDQGENTAEETAENEPETTKEETPANNTNEISGQTDTKTTSTGKVITFKVTAGESSYKVAENLYRAGLIDNPTSFNTYLESNGYDNTIHVGSFDIPEGSTYEQIANTISK